MIEGPEELFKRLQTLFPPDVIQLRADVVEIRLDKLEMTEMNLPMIADLLGQAGITSSLTSREGATWRVSVDARRVDGELQAWLVLRRLPSAQIPDDD